MDDARNALIFAQRIRPHNTLPNHDEFLHSIAVCLVDRYNLGKMEWLIQLCQDHPQDRHLQRIYNYALNHALAREPEYSYRLFCDQRIPEQMRAAYLRGLNDCQEPSRSYTQEQVTSRLLNHHAINQQNTDARNLFFKQFTGALAVLFNNPYHRTNTILNGIQEMSSWIPKNTPSIFNEFLCAFIPHLIAQENDKYHQFLELTLALLNKFSVPDLQFSTTDKMLCIAQCCLGIPITFKFPFYKLEMHPVKENAAFLAHTRSLPHLENLREMRTYFMREGLNKNRNHLAVSFFQSALLDTKERTILYNSLSQEHRDQLKELIGGDTLNTLININN